MSALDVQVGGNHYKKRGIQPVEYIHANDLDFFQGNVVKYVTRWRDKDGVKDLLKAKHYLELYIELETKKAETLGKVVPPTEATATLTMGRGSMANPLLSDFINDRKS